MSKMHFKTAVQEKILFLYKFLRAPKQIGSVTPSSKVLSRKMVDSINWDQVKNVAELGAGTGSITKYIRSAKQSQTKVILFEKDPYLRGELKKNYTDFPCYTDACQLQNALMIEEMEQLDCILSGLPFFNFPQPIQNRIMHQIFDSLKPGGLFIAFQYSQQMKYQFNQLFETDVKFVLLNVPPAFVYICRKK
jgi:phospholipid N-methyltransferase